MDGPPALTLGMEPIDEDVKLQPPRDTKKDLITYKLIRNCIISAAVIICGTLWVFRYCFIYLNLLKVKLNYKNFILFYFRYFN